MVRLYRFNNPIADWHSWRQADTSAVSRNFVNSGFDLLHPRFDDLSNVPSVRDNPQGYRFVEFPIYNVAQAGLFKIFGFLTLEEWGRMVTILTSLTSVVLIFLIMKRYTNNLAALCAALFYSIVPYNIYYGRVILPDPLMVTSILAGVWFFDLFAYEKENFRKVLYFALALIFTASALLLKPFAIFFALPMVAIAYNRWGFTMFKKPLLYGFLIATLLPLIFWRIWMTQYPEGIPQSGWLLNGGHIRFTGAFFYWIFAQRIGGLILGFWGATFLVIGMIFNSKAEKYWGLMKGQGLYFWSFLVASLLYVTIVARGNVQHDYYQILIIPTIAMFVGLGAAFLLNPPKEIFDRKISLMVVVVCMLFGLAFRWYVIRDYFNINNPSIVAAGAAVDKLTPKNAKVVANYDGDTSFLYQTKRKGWASYEKDLPGLVALGADYLVLANPTPGDYQFGKGYKIVVSTPQYVLFNLREKE